MGVWFEADGRFKQLLSPSKHRAMHNHQDTFTRIPEQGITQKDTFCLRTVNTLTQLLSLVRRALVTMITKWQTKQKKILRPPKSTHLALGWFPCLEENSCVCVLWFLQLRLYIYYNALCSHKNLAPNKTDIHKLQIRPGFKQNQPQQQ